MWCDLARFRQAKEEVGGLTIVEVTNTLLDPSTREHGRRLDSIRPSDTAASPSSSSASCSRVVLSMGSSCSSSLCYAYSRVGPIGGSCCTCLGVG